MKHAILILSSYGVDYLVENIKQYSEYQDIFDIFVHVDGKTYEDILSHSVSGFRQYVGKLTEMNNIKYVGHEYQAKKYSFELLLSEFHLFRRAIETDTYCIYHIVSESCYLYKDKDVFLDFFEKNPDINLIGLETLSGNIFDEETGIKNVYKGPQWLSLSHKTLSKAIKKHLFEKICDDWENGLIDKPDGSGAIDEIVLHTYIMNFIIDDKGKETYFQSRFILWGNYDERTNNGSPNTLSTDFLKKGIKMNEYELKNSFWCRKIDYKNPESKNFLKYLKINYGKIKIEK